MVAVMDVRDAGVSSECHKPQVCPGNIFLKKTKRPLTGRSGIIEALCVNMRMVCVSALPSPCTEIFNMSGSRDLD